MQVVRVIDRVFEVDGKLKVGEVVKAGDCLAVVVSVSGEEPEYVKYAGELSREEVEAFMPDVVERKVVSKCYVLRGMGESFSPDVGDEVREASDEEIREFHTRNGEFRIPYFYQLLKIDIDVAKSVLLRLKKVFEGDDVANREIIDILLREIDYMLMHGRA